MYTFGTACRYAFACMCVCVCHLASPSGCHFTRTHFQYLLCPLYSASFPHQLSNLFRDGLAVSAQQVPFPHFPWPSVLLHSCLLTTSQRRSLFFLKTLHNSPLLCELIFNFLLLFLRVWYLIYFLLFYFIYFIFLIILFLEVLLRILSLNCLFVSLLKLDDHNQFYNSKIMSVA